MKFFIGSVVLLVSAITTVWPIAAVAQDVKTIQIAGISVSVTRTGETWNARFPESIRGAVAGDATTLSRYRGVLVGAVERAAGCSVSQSTISADGRDLQATVDCRPGAPQPAHLAKSVLFSASSLEKLVACDDYAHVSLYEWIDPASDEWLGQLLSRERPLLNYGPSTPQFRLVQTPAVIGLKTAGISSNIGMMPGGVLLFEQSFDDLEKAVRARGVDLQCEQVRGDRMCARTADVAIAPDMLRGQQNAVLHLLLLESRQIQRNGVLLACVAKWPGRMR